ncbi:MAG: DUF502 domain-containing protein [Planctomycetota bacterium]
MTDQSKRISSLVVIRNRIIQGLFVILPFFITYAVIAWMYETLYAIALSPIAKGLKVAWKLDKELLPWWVEFGLGCAAFGLVLGLLFMAGMFIQTRTLRIVEWIFLNVPGVNTVYSAVRNVINAISSSSTADPNKFKRVVLVEFPSPGFKAPAFVTGECQDKSTGNMILSVYVPTTPVPTSGYMLLVNENDVTELNWDLEETLQAIVSGGITVPKTVTFEKDPPINLNT